MAYYSNLIWNTLNSIFGWFESIIGSFGITAWSLILALVVLNAMYKYILSPYLSGFGGFGSSDKADFKTKKGG